LPAALHPRLSVSGHSTINFSLQEDLALYASLGLRQFGLTEEKLLEAGIGPGTDLVRQSGLSVSTLCCRAPFSLASPSQWDEQRERFHLLVNAAAAVGSPTMMMTPGTAGSVSWEDAARALGEAIGPSIGYAADRGIVLALEHTHMLRCDLCFVHSLRDMVELARELGSGACAELCVCFGERGLSSTFRDGAGIIALVQLGDFVKGTVCSGDRAVPGDGDVPLARLLPEVLASGYAGAFDLEIIGPRIEQEGYPSAIRRSLAVLTGLLDQAGA
jgi:sugar phosphate isomerase/epimerase